MSNEAQELIAAIRHHMEEEEYPQAVALLRNAPADRSTWTAHEQDEIACLEEFLGALGDSSASMVRL